MPLAEGMAATPPAPPCFHARHPDPGAGVSASPLFLRAFELVVVREEGGLSLDYWDPGNWTGGAVGRGLCRGTDKGLSAAAFPTLDFPVSTAVAQAIYRRKYWDPIGGDDLPAGVGVMVFDSAVNQGVGFAARALQQAVHVTADGVVGPETLSAVSACPAHALLRGVFVLRALEYARGSARFQKGWFARLYRISAASAALAEGRDQ